MLEKCKECLLPGQQGHKTTSASQEDRLEGDSQRQCCLIRDGAALCQYGDVAHRDCVPVPYILLSCALKNHMRVHVAR